MAILDRHILKGLNLLGVIDKIPGLLSRQKYVKIEKMMNEFAKRIEIPMSHLDFVFRIGDMGSIMCIKLQDSEG